MVPMRSIPAKVIAVLGMNEDAFPRRESNESLTIFDKITRKNSLVRSKNTEDRYLFLEVVLAARKHLLFFYDGMDDKTNKAKVMSTPLAELYDVLKRTFPEEEFVVIHKLQAFDQDYFLKGESQKLFSYSKANYSACKAFLDEFSKEETSPSKITYKAQGNISDKEWVISPYELSKFFTSSCEEFFNYIFNVRGIFSDAVNFNTDDVLSLDNLESSILKKEILKYNLQGINSSKIKEYLSKKGLLPLYLDGDKIFTEFEEIVNSIPETFKLKIKSLTPKNIEVVFPNILGHKITISGPINVGSDGNYYNYSFSSTEEKTLIPSWINYLLLQVNNSNVKANYWIASQSDKIKAITLNEGANATDVLRNILELFIIGHESCLPFFLSSSRSYYKTYNDFLDEEKALKAATKAFYTPDSFNGDKGDWVYGDKVKYFYDNDVFDKADDDFLSQFKSSALAFYESMAIEEVPQEIE